MDQNKLDDALTYLYKSQDLMLKNYGEDYPTLAICYCNIGHCKLRLGKYEDALEILNKALKIG